MIVIADSSPLRYLILIGRVEILRDLFRQIVVPASVIGELAHPNSPAPVHAWIVNPPEWLILRVPQSVDKSLSGRLGAGESEAIAIAEELGADALLTDDNAARKEAERRRIPVQGTLGVLDLAAQIGLADLPAALADLSATNFRASRKLIQFFLDRDAE